MTNGDLFPNPSVCHPISVENKGGNRSSDINAAQNVLDAVMDIDAG